MYQSEGEKIYFVSRNGEKELAATCDKSEEAAKLMNRAGFLNDVKRQYTASVRLFYQAECLAGFQWAEIEKEKKS